MTLFISGQLLWQKTLPKAGFFGKFCLSGFHPQQAQAAIANRSSLASIGFA
jgi:hypothetical protein